MRHRPQQWMLCLAVAAALTLYAVARVRRLQELRNVPPPAIVFSPASLLSGAALVRGIEDIRRTSTEVCFTANGGDPYFHLPKLSRRPRGLSFSVELTGPGPMMLQLYYQTPSVPRMTEEQSVRVSLPSGRQTVQWRLREPLTGVLRLDPGNIPGRYCIHRIEIEP